MTEFSEGDLIEATKGDTVIRGRMVQAPGNGLRPIFTVTDAVRFDPLHLEANGYTLTLIEKAAPALPTEPGWYLSRTGQLWVIKPGVPLHWTDDLPGIEVNPRNYAPFTRLEPVPVTVKRVVDQILARGSIVAGLHVVERHHIKQVAKEFGVTDA